MTLQETALAYLADGLAPLPVVMLPDLPHDHPQRVERHKRPAISWKALQDKQPSAAGVSRMPWTARSPKEGEEPEGRGIATACGAGSGGIEVIDFDVPGKHEPGYIPVAEPPAWASWRDTLEASRPGLLKRLVVAKTESGGRHVFYRCPNPAGNLKLAASPQGDALIETRGQGGYIIIEPTPGYSFLDGRTPADIPTITQDERDELVTLGRVFDESPPKPEPAPPRQRSQTPEGERLGDDFNIRADWLADVLEPHGWRVFRQRGSVIDLTRPGKPGGGSATIGYGGYDTFYVFTSSAPPFDPDTGYTKFTAYAMLNHAGDFAAAARDLAGKGYGKTIPASSPLPSSPRATTAAPGQQKQEGPTPLVPIYRYGDFLDELRQHSDSIPTGYPDLDRKCRFPPSALTIIAGRPGHGKTTALMNFARQMLLSDRAGDVLFFSLEEPRRFIAAKLLMAQSGRSFEGSEGTPTDLERYLRWLANDHPLQDGSEDERAATDVAAAVGQVRSWLEEGRLRIATDYTTADDIAAAIESHPRPVCGVFIDYLQKVRPPAKARSYSRQTDIAEASERFRVCAGTTGLPLIIGAQLRRQEAGKSSESVLSLDHLRESGDIEQDAHLVLGVYNPLAAAKSHESDAEDVFGDAPPLQFHVLKNRSGQVSAKVELSYMPSLYLMTNRGSQSGMSNFKPKSKQ